MILGVLLTLLNFCNTQFGTASVAAKACYQKSEQCLKSLPNNMSANQKYNNCKDAYKI